MLVYYHMMLFSKFMADVDMWFELCYSFTVTLVLLILVNVLTALVGSIMAAKRSKKLKELKKLFERRLLNIHTNLIYFKSTLLIQSELREGNDEGQEI